MEQLKLLGVALGLASLAGVNLYLTVFATGLSIHYHWITLGPPYESLDVLGHPAVIVISGVLYFLEFFADKIPWVDSAWDAVHTVIRPIGGALLAIQVLGQDHQLSPAVSVIVALLAGGTSLLTHSAKSSTRLASNASPEPFSNIALSVGEDAAVLGGLALIHFNPLLALAVFAVVVAIVFYFAARMLRAIKARVWLALKKLNFPAGGSELDDLPTTLSMRLDSVFDKENILDETISWAVPCVSGRGRRIPPNLFGALVATEEEPHKVTFVARKNGRPFAQRIELEGAMVAHEPKFLSENLTIFPQVAKGPKYLFVFARPDAGRVEKIVRDLRRRLSSPTSIEAPPAAAVTIPREENIER